MGLSVHDGTNRQSMHNNADLCQYTDTTRLEKISLLFALILNVKSLRPYFYLSYGTDRRLALLTTLKFEAHNSNHQFPLFLLSWMTPHKYRLALSPPENIFGAKMFEWVCDRSVYLLCTLRVSS